jgi:glutamyl-tRNA synthetase
MFEDLRWLGLNWDEGPDVGGPFGPYNQSERRSSHQKAFEGLRDAGFLYPCTCSRKDVLQALQAPHQGDEEPIYPGTCRGKTMSDIAGKPANWRFRVPDGQEIIFRDGHFGEQRFMAGKDFGDFVVWRNDGIPSYQLAVTVDDAAMQITEVVRGADLLLSTARQLLLYGALGLTPPAFFHCPLMTDVEGVRLAKRNDALSLRTLRAQGFSSEQVRAKFDA